MSGEASKLNKNKIADLCVLLTLAGLVALYGVDAARASTHVLNLILVLPLTIIVLCLVQFAMDVPHVRAEEDSKEPVSTVLSVMALFTAYVLSLNWLGFDVGSFLFIGAFLWLHGERRWPWVIGYALSFAMLMALFFSTMLPYPMPMLVLETAY